MSKVICGLSVSVDGFITGRDPRPGHGLGDGGVLFDWYGSGDVPSTVFAGFRLSAPSVRVFDALASRVGASLADTPPIPIRTTSPAGRRIPRHPSWCCRTRTSRRRTSGRRS